MKKKYDLDIMVQFNFYKGWVGIFRCLRLEERGVLLNWMFWYCFEKSEPTEEHFNTYPKLEQPWYKIKEDLDEQKEKWAYYADAKNVQNGYYK